MRQFGAEFRAHAPHVDIDRAAAAVVIEAPHAAQERIAGIRAARMRHQKREQRILQIREVERLTVHLHLIGRQIDRHVVDGDVIRGGALVAGPQKLADAGSEIQQNALEAHGEASGIAELAEQRIYSIRQGREIKGLSRLSEVIADLYTELDERARSDSEIPGMSTGFHALDTALTGLNKSDLILIAARPGMGKTAFALNVALNAAKASVKNKERGDKKGTGVCVFQLEMGKEQLASRFLSSEALIESQKLKTGNLDGDDWVKIARASGVLAGLNIYVDDNPAITVAEIKAKCRRLGDELGLIVIDYLQLMHVGGRHMDNRVQEVAEISRSLKIMAKELNVPVVCLSQLSRASEQRSDKRPMLSDLRESGAIEQDADIVMFIYRDDYYDDESENKNIAEIIIAKNRHGATGTIELQWVGQYTTFSNPDRIHEE